MIDISGLDKSFGGRRLFVGAEMRVGARDRIALVGPNGSGKTTLFEMIAGRQDHDAGSINLTKGATLGYLEQDTDALRGRTVLDEVLRSGSEVARVEHRLQVLVAEMSELGDGPEQERAVAEYGRLEDRYRHLGGYSAEAEAKRILAGLGFEEGDHARSTETFSGGWQMRIVLARLLLEGPDVLMLDEPTNHLDLASIEWLERYLDGYEGAVLMISHDRDFMNTFATRVVEITELKLVSYTGNFSDFVRQKQEAIERAEATAKRQADRRAQLEVFINRFRYKDSKAKQVQSKIKMLERMNPVHRPQDTKRAMNLMFPPAPRSGRVVLNLEDITFGYGAEPVYEGLDLVVERGQKVALVGPNGAGKTTLLKLAAGVLEPQAGERLLGHKVAAGYFAQHQIEALEATNTVLEELTSALPRASDIKPRDLLGRFLFSGDDVDKRVDVLSGGEKTRLALAKLLAQPFNLLCLDEPTNHLDMWSRDILEEALDQYDGSFVLITHDRHLIRSVATHIVEVVDGRVTWFEGDYDYYLDRRDPETPLPTPKPKAEGPGPRGKAKRRLAAEQRDRTKHLRGKISAIESKLTALTEQEEEMKALLSDPAAYGSGTDVKELSERYQRVARQISHLESQWDVAAEALERTETETSS